MKKFTIIKMGYSTGAYGCGGEYFLCIILDGDEVKQFKFKGLYGVENRIESALKDKGYQFFYSYAPFGKITGEDKSFYDNEYQTLEKIKNLK